MLSNSAQAVARPCPRRGGPQEAARQEQAVGCAGLAAGERCAVGVRRVGRCRANADRRRDADKLVASLQEVVELRLKHGPQDKLLNTLSLLLPSSPLVPLIQTTQAPPGSYVPLAVPKYPAPEGSPVPAIPGTLPHVFHLAGSLPLTLLLLLRVQNEVHTLTEAKVKAGRQRIGARSERHVRRQVDGEVLTGPWGARMIDLLRDVSAHPGVDEEVRRDVEVQEFDYWRRLVDVLPQDGAAKGKPEAAPEKPKIGGMVISSLPPKPPAQVVEDPDTPELFKSPVAPKTTKAEARDRANSLADGFVLLGVGGAAEDAWNWVIDGRDEPTIGGLCLPSANPSVRPRLAAQVRAHVHRVSTNRLYR